MKLRLMLIIVTFALANPAAPQLIPPKIEQKLITGKLSIQNTAYNNETRILAVYVGRDPDSFMILPKELYPELKAFEGKHVIIKGRAASSPGMQNTIKVKSIRDVVEKGTVTLKGTVVSAMIKSRRMIMLQDGKLLYTPLDEIGMEALSPFRDKDVEVKCYMAGMGMESKRIDEIVSVALRQLSAEAFDFPHSSYLRLLKNEGRFGSKADTDNYPDGDGRISLGEDTDLKAGAPVTSIADGIVKYTGFIPSGTTKDGKPFRGMGHIAVVEHRLARPEPGLEYVCAVYTCLGAELKVKAGDQIKLGQTIGLVGRPDSDENGKYPAHLHLGLHKGPYNQLSPAQKREITFFAKEVGLPGMDGSLIKGKVTDIKLVNDTFAELTIEGNPESIRISLLVQPVPPGSDAEAPKPIFGWLQMHGDEKALDEWLNPSVFIKKRK